MTNSLSLVDLLPIHPNNHKYVVEQRIQQFNDLKKCVYIIKLVVDETAALEQIYYTMWLLETHRLSFGGIRAASTEEHPFLVIARSLTKMFPETESQYQVYWIAKAVYDLATQADTDSLVAQTYAELEGFDAILLR